MLLVFLTFLPNRFLFYSLFQIIQLFTYRILSIKILLVTLKSEKNEKVDKEAKPVTIRR